MNTFGTNVTRELSTSPAFVQSAEIDEIWKLRGLDKSNPATFTKTEVTVGGITIDITGDGENTSTFTRQ